MNLNDGNREDQSCDALFKRDVKANQRTEDAHQIQIARRSQLTSCEVGPAAWSSVSGDRTRSLRRVCASHAAARLQQRRQRNLPLRPK